MDGTPGGQFEREDHHRIESGSQIRVVRGIESAVNIMLALKQGGRPPATLRPRVPQPHQLHRQEPAQDRRVQAAITPSIVKSRETGRKHGLDNSMDRSFHGMK
jgi:hypothetical protein